MEINQRKSSILEMKWCKLASGIKEKKGIKLARSWCI